jgi:hypothetical protein
VYKRKRAGTVIDLAVDRKVGGGGSTGLRTLVSPQGISGHTVVPEISLLHNPVLSSVFSGM